MFHRGYIKELAKGRLRAGPGGNAVLAALLMTLLGASGSFYTHISSVKSQLNIRLDGGVPVVFGFAFLALFSAGMLYRLLAGNIIQAGGHGWFLRYWRGEPVRPGEVFASFRIYLPCLKTTLFRDVLVFLWSLLFVIPGIIMGYAYSMAEYIIYENPNLPPKRALDMSRAMTDGYKMEIFVFELSYMGWHLLSALTCGILAIVYVNPYYHTARAGLYEALKAAAIQRGVLTWEDFGQYPPVYQPAPPPFH